MADQTAPDDGFERYFAEKLWDRVPSVYREEDGAAERPGVLRALIEVIASQAATLRRSHDRQWEDRFIDLCDSWAVPYIGALVGTRLVSALDPAARRVDVAKTIYYRRRKGTPRVLEELIADIARWEGVVVEAFRGLLRAPHGLEPPPARARFSGTPRGGLADLRRPFASTLAGGPFDEYAHTPDVRRGRGGDGRWSIPKVAFHLYRLRALPVAGVTPFARPGGGFTFDPSGRDIPLFAPRTRAADFDAWRAALPWELPAPISCRLLNDAAFALDDNALAALGAVVPAAALADLGTIRGVRYADEARFVAQLGRLPQAATLLAAAILPAILEAGLQPGGHAALLPIDPTVRPAFATLPAVRPSLVVGARLDGWTAVAPGKRLAVDPERGRIAALDPAAAPILVDYHTGTPGPIGAGTYARGAAIAAATAATPPTVAAGGGALALPADALVDVSDSRTYGPIADPPAFASLVVQALDGQRPYFSLTTDLTFNAAPAGSALVLEGLWFGSSGPRRLILQGPFRKVTIRHCTLDPGGADVTGAPIGPITLHLAGAIDELLIDASILGPLEVAPGAVVDALTIQDSVLQSRVPATPALDSPLGEVHLLRTTVLGDLRAERLWADDTLIAGVADVTDTQAGCFRFSAAFTGSRLPHPFESVVLPDARGLFSSTRFGDPAYAQLAEAAPSTVARGAEAGSEMGAFCSLDNPIKADSLARKVDEFLPFGLVPIYLNAD